MTDTTEITTAADVSLNINVTDCLTFDTTDRDADVYVTRPANTPLLVGESHATIKAATEDGTVELTLDGEQLDAVVAGLRAAQAFHYEGAPEVVEP